MTLAIAYGIAVVATVLLALYVRHRYPAMPKRMPQGLRLDGRARRTVARGWMWLPPAVLAAVLASLGAALAYGPLQPQTAPVMAGVFLEIALVAYAMAWALDRQIEIARKMTVRIAPARMIRMACAVLVPLAVLVVAALRS